MNQCRLRLGQPQSLMLNIFIKPLAIFFQSSDFCMCLFSFCFWQSKIQFFHFVDNPVLFVTGLR